MLNFQVTKIFSNYIFKEKLQDKYDIFSSKRVKKSILLVFLTTLSQPVNKFFRKTISFKSLIHFFHYMINRLYLFTFELSSTQLYNCLSIFLLPKRVFT
ncbi:hypothetical protein BpHYR1_046220 [Brachionus plicatilis]|uniref:Uncharacterized protein n=1 Tax=Brachionus plicatilis TaxID=10195 RepID=A0A3M7SN26_BRAPC|nr:hypothetical protein BpHYR1_046220 [Brachionus plicatilis]